MAKQHDFVFFQLISAKIWVLRHGKTLKSKYSHIRVVNATLIISLWSLSNSQSGRTEGSEDTEGLFIIMKKRHHPFFPNCSHDVKYIEIMNMMTGTTGFSKQVGTVKSRGVIWQKTVCPVSATWTSDYVCIEGLRSNKTIFFFNSCGGTLGTAATTGLLYQPRMIGEGDCGEISGMKIGRGNRSTR
jgi:hypothetical protein